MSLPLRSELRSGLSLRGAPLAGVTDDREFQRERLERERGREVAGNDLKMRSRTWGSSAPCRGTQKPDRAEKCGRGPARMGYPQHGCVRENPPQLDDGPSPSRGQMNDQQDDADDEEDPRDLRRDGGPAGGTSDTRDQSDDMKHYWVIMHFATSL